LTEKSKKIPALINQYAGWTLDSKMSGKYFHYFSNESNTGVLQAYGILPKDDEELDILKPKECPNCNNGNKPDSKFCASCRMVLTYDSYMEMLEKERQRDMDVKQLTAKVKELSEDHELLVQMYEHDPQERRKLKTLYREANRNGTRKPGQLLYLKKSDYTPDSFAYHAYGDKSSE